MSTHPTFSFKRGNLQKLFFIPAYVLGYILSWIIPRRAHSWVFGSGVGIGEGALAVAQELRRRDPHAIITWLAATEEDRERAKALGFQSELTATFAGFWATLTARTLVVTHGLGDVQRFGVFRARVINLWHGAPLKKLHLDSAVTTEVGGFGFVNRLLTRMYRSGAEQVDVYAAGSVTAAERLRSAFRVIPGRVRVLGDARLDSLVSSLHRPEMTAALRAELAEQLHLADEQSRKKWVLYAPTWRDGDENAAIPDEDEARRITAWAEAEGVLLCIRSHPLGRGAYEHLYGNSVVPCSAESLPDVTPVLGVFDAVITDYSSIAIDFALTGRPIVWFAPDLEAYAERRGLYEPYEATTEGHFTRSWDDMLSRASRMLDTESGAHRAARLRTARLADRFHAYTDGASAGRVLDHLDMLDRPHAGLATDGAIFFESFYGTLATCNPFAIDREIAARHPDLLRYWSVQNETTPVPEGAIALLVGSAEWKAVRRTAHLLVVNDWLRFGFKARRHQFVLQTWHGTPLKRIALERSGQSLRTKLAVRRESRRWNALIAQNAEAGQWLKRSYRFTGHLLEMGYPRNDRLANAAHAGVRLSTPQLTARNKLGLGNDEKIVLYAPTWRETQRGHTVDTLNVAHLAERLGGGWTILARGHSRDASFAHYSGARVIDMTHHDDVNDLIIAADVFITDYSSLMFDVSAACVPTILYVPDLERYRTTERGLMFDITEAPPGPLLTDTEEVARYLAEFAELEERASWVLAHENNVRLWRERWNAHDDGRSSARVVDWLTEQGRLASRSA